MTFVELYFYLNILSEKKSIVLIDGSNFYFKLKDLGFHNLLNFNFTEFVKLISHSSNVVSPCYYVGRIKQDRTKHTQKLFDGQQKLLAQLKKHSIVYSLGYLMKSNGIFHEKGVDIQMAVDMLVASYENSCDRIILVSSDTDLLPAIKKAQERGKIIEYIGFSHKPSIAMVSTCSESKLLTKDEISTLVK
ncbi:MAG: NYN domain-containing protein [Patescibacteria group bacterium]